MDYIYGELNKEIAIDPYGGSYVGESDSILTTLTSDFTYIPLIESFNTDGQTFFYNITGDSKYQYFAYPTPYGLLTSIERDGTEDIANWVLSDVPVIDGWGTIYYLYRTLSKIDKDSNITFKV